MSIALLKEFKKVITNDITGDANSFLNGLFQDNTKRISYVTCLAEGIFFTSQDRERKAHIYKRILLQVL